MVNTRDIAPLPPDLEKNASQFWNLARMGGSALKNVLVGQGDDLLRQRGLLKGVRKWVTPSGWSNVNWNKAINLASQNVDEAGKLIAKPELIKGTQLASEAAKIDPTKLINQWWNLPGQYIGGERGWNVLKSRYLQGGLFGKGGVARSTFATNPRLYHHWSNLKEGKNIGKSILGLGYRGGLEVAKKGLGVGLPAYSVYQAFNPQEGDERSLGQRLGGTIGNTLGTYASLAMGPASWAPSFAAQIAALPGWMDPQGKTFKTIERMTPWGLGEYAGEVVGTLGNRKKFDPVEAHMKRMMQQRQAAIQRYQQNLRPRQYMGPNPYTRNFRQMGSSYLPYGSGRLTGYSTIPRGRSGLPQPQLPQGLLYTGR